jgi:hypothetical protein
MNTLEYINYRVENNSVNDYIVNVNWNEAMVKEPMSWLKGILEQDLAFDKDGNFDVLLVKENSDKRKRIQIIYKKDIEPDIFRCSGGTHDGTLLFSLQYIGRLFETLVNAASYKKGYIPKNYILDENIWWEYDIIYYVSDLLWHINHVDHVDAEHGKMFPGSHDEMIMAVQIEYIRNNN